VTEMFKVIIVWGELNDVRCRDGEMISPSKKFIMFSKVYSN